MHAIKLAAAVEFVCCSRNSLSELSLNFHRTGHGENYPNTDIFAVSCSQNGLLKKPLTMIYIINISRITIPELFNYHLLYETLKFVPFKISIVVFKFYTR